MALLALFVCLKQAHFSLFVAPPIADAFERIPLILEVDVVSVMHA